MPKRLAITIAGAVSLGSYEAGVLYEIIAALGEHNGKCSPGDKILIDVITGASAGGICATIAAQKLLFEEQTLRDPYDNAFYNPWVIRGDIIPLLNTRYDDPSLSILSSSFVEALAREFLLSRYQTGLPVARTPHPAAAPTIWLGLAMSNLNGVDYSVQTRTGDKFFYTRFQDAVVGELTRGANSDKKEIWERFQNAAVGCGAFPFAFRVKELIRNRNEFPAQNLDPWTTPTRPFAYTDGGVFQNEPLGLAKNLVDNIDQHQNSESRSYLFVAPRPKGASAQDDFRASAAKFWSFAQRLAGAVLSQAEYQDWINAESINEQIHVFNVRARQLKDALLNGQIKATDLEPAAQALLPKLFAVQSSSSNEAMAQARARLKQQFAEEYAALGGDGNAEAAVWLDSILVLESAAEIQRYDEMNIYGITASDKELAGKNLHAFQGFFAQKLRVHDYNIGRSHARDFLAKQRHVQAGPNVLGPIQYDPTDKIPPDDGLGSATFADLDRNLRLKARDQILNRIDELLKEMSIPWIIRSPLENFYLKKKINDQFDL
jgi:hypothetical protein